MHRILLNKFFKKHIAITEECKILIPYLGGNIFGSLLEAKPLLKLVCLSKNNRQTARQIPVTEEARSRLLFIKNDIRSHRGLLDYDIIYCASLNKHYETKCFQEELCLCRILLKPGGKLFIRSVNSREGSFRGLFFSKRSPLRRILLGAGFCDIAVHKLRDGQIICSGKRPSHLF